MKVLTPIMELPHWYYDMKWPSVQEAFDFLYPNNTYTEKHRALDDAKHEAKIVYKTNKIRNNVPIYQVQYENREVVQSVF
jgi:inhibitor of KinA sporulation pathway (predicted exonuclease)